MEKKLRTLFDYQRFENNQILNDEITTVNQMTSNALLDEKLSFAAGGKTTENTKEELNSNQNTKIV